MTGVSTLSQTLANIRVLTEQTTLLDSLTTQLATGRRTQEFTGLGNDIIASKRARADLNQSNTYISNITNADRRIELELDAIREFQAQARNLADSLVEFSRESVHQEGNIISFDDPLTPEIEDIRIGTSSEEPDVDFATIKDLARNLFRLLGDLLNSQESDRYLLGGADAFTQPYTDTGTLDAAISSLITRFKDETAPNNISAQELTSALLTRDSTQDANAITDTIVGYSAALSAGNVGDVFVRVDEQIEIEYTALANEDPFRDILVAAAYIASDDLGPIADVYAEPYTLGDAPLVNGAPGATIEEQKDNFFAVFDEMARTVVEAIDDIDAVQFRLENARVRIEESRQSHIRDNAALQDIIDEVENVDINEVALQLNSLQLQVEASFRVTASISQLSLVNFL